MIALLPVTPENIPSFKSIRLRALADDPKAFGSTYAREAAFDDAEWLRRALRWNGEIGIGYLAMDGATACGIAGGLLEENDPACATLVSMWTARSHRKAGVGRLLVEGVADWARSRRAATLRLTVVSGNEAAIRFYAGLGFTMTGSTEPYPNDPDLFEYEMSMAI